MKYFIKYIISFRDVLIIEVAIFSTTIALLTIEAIYSTKVTIYEISLIRFLISTIIDIFSNL